MKVFGNLTKKLYVGSACLMFGLVACGGDDATSAKEPDGNAVVPSSASEVGESSASESVSSSESSGTPSSSAASAPAVEVSSSSKKTETQDSKEQLAEAHGIVKGACGPEVNVINKGEIVTWKFYRETGDVFDAIMSPFVWTFPELGKSVSGNGSDKVNMTYPDPGVYSAVLNVDGTEVLCDPLQVQGVPITVNSCKADKGSANVGDVITWSVDVSSEAKIVNYEWTTTSEGAVVSASGDKASVTAVSEMHKQNISVSVAVTNDDKTTQTYNCSSVAVMDPSKVDVVIPIATGKDGAVEIPKGEALIAQIVSGAQNCKMACNIVAGSELIIDGESFKEENVYTTYIAIELPGCTSPGGNFKFSLVSANTSYCWVDN